ncbi:MAG: hypothetical protein K5765_03055 [Clostridia bacterium]|nr:hypothetical protein [Clostridia bacterium]
MESILMNSTKCRTRSSIKGSLFTTSICFFGIYLLLFIGTFLESPLIKIIATMVCLICLVLFDEAGSFELLALITPSSRLLKISDNLPSLIILCYIIVFVRFLFFKKIRFEKKFICCFLILTFICGFRILSNNIYDLVLLFGIIIAVVDWKHIICDKSVSFQIEIVRAFLIGVVFLFFGMVISSYILGSAGRMEALSDDPNYTAVVYSVGIAVIIYFMFNRIKLKHSLLYLFVCVLGGMLTGSRGFILSLAFVVLLYFIYGIVNSRARKFIYVIIILLILFIVFYFIKVPFVISFYDKTVGRTLELFNNYSSGNFMDISSGRFVLWNYYINLLFSDFELLLFGHGFETYYLVEYGGYGMVAHNFIIAGAMGFGIIGLISIFIIYFSMRKTPIRNVVDLSLFSCFFVSYLFLDGILDFRISLYFALLFMCLNIKRYRFARN